jgi:hypothetical protein
MPLLAKPVTKTMFGFSLLLVPILSLSYYIRYQNGALNPCKIIKEKLVAMVAQPYSGTTREPNFLEPVALVLARRRVNNFVEQKSHVECLTILYHSWRNPKEIESRVRELNK